MTGIAFGTITKPGDAGIFSLLKYKNLPLISGYMGMSQIFSGV
jgi:hypothetical protein